MNGTYTLEDDTACTDCGTWICMHGTTKVEKTLMGEVDRLKHQNLVLNRIMAALILLCGVLVTVMAL